jgi:hypothetical protein
MCRRITDRGVPLLIWMSHSGLMYQGGPDIDDDWFIRGVDGRICAAWGTEDQPELAHINPGHPGYIEYTRKWIRFYMQECGAKGIWFDCLGWAFPADFRPRSFMRYPGDTNRMAIKFIEEIGAYIKELDPEAIFGGEGTTLDAPQDLVSVNFNPVRAVDGLGPRDFLLKLNAHGSKRLVLDQGPQFSAAAGMTRALQGEGAAEKNRCLLKLLQEKGGRRAFMALPGDLAVHAEEPILVVPSAGGGHGKAAAMHARLALPAPWSRFRTLVSETDGARFAKGRDGAFRNVPPGVYRMG